MRHPSSTAAILPRLPLCGRYHDTHGTWRNVSDFVNNTIELERHFLLGGAGEALQFPQVWLPHDCAVHRFTNYSIQAMISHTLQMKDKPNGGILKVFMFGDSAVRGFVLWDLPHIRGIRPL